jgi:hypothetical protein
MGALQPAVTAMIITQAVVSKNRICVLFLLMILFPDVWRQSGRGVCCAVL